MDYGEVVQTGGNTVVKGLRNFCLDDILDCGQCFRWEKLSDGHWRGIVGNSVRTLSQSGEELTLYGADPDEFYSVWYNYFDFGRDYGKVKGILTTDEAMRQAIRYTPGIRVLRQEPWETLCSFILSQNNNIKRIRGLVARLCENFGERIEGGFAFPAPEALAGLSEIDLAPVRCGFRAKYVLDAARRTAEGAVCLESLFDAPLADALHALQSISGVGPKVAACVMLYGYGRAESVPFDVWMNRALDAFYPRGMPENILPVAGLGQQYLFHYMRNFAAGPQFAMSVKK